VLACATAGIDQADQFISLAVELSSDKVEFMLPMELSGSTFAFGHASKMGLGGDALQRLLRRLVEESAAQTGRFDARQLAGMLHSCARFAFPAAEADLARLAAALLERTSGPELELEAAAQGLRALVQLLDPRHPTSGLGGSAIVAEAGNNFGTPDALSGAGLQSGADLQISKDGGDSLQSLWSSACSLDKTLCKAVAAIDTTFDDAKLGLSVVQACFLFDCLRRDARLAAAGVLDSQQTPPGDADLQLSLADALAARLARGPLAPELARQLQEGLLKVGAGSEHAAVRSLAEHMAAGSAPGQSQS